MKYKGTIKGKGVTGGPSGPSPGVRHKIVSDTKRIAKERKKEKKEWEKGKICKEKENRRKSERKMDGNKRKEIQKCS